MTPRLRTLLALRAVALALALGAVVTAYYEVGVTHRLDLGFAGFAVWALGCGANVRLRDLMWQELDAGKDDEC